MQANEQTLVQAILQNPHSDSARLAYANWLDSSANRHDHCRAELIRLQIDLERTASEDDRSIAMEGREKELLSNFQSLWEKPYRDLFKPSMLAPTQWLKTQLFGRGGSWGFRRGFIENVLTSAPTFLAEDAKIFDFVPVQHVVLSRSSQYVNSLLQAACLNKLKSLHLIADMELDEDLNVLIANAKEAGLHIYDFRLPRLIAEAADLYTLLAEMKSGEAEVSLDDMNSWKLADSESRSRIMNVFENRSTRKLFLEPHTASQGQLLDLEEWVYVGDLFTRPGVWAIAKSHQGLGDDEDRARHIVLTRTERLHEFKESRYFQEEIE